MRGTRLPLAVAAVALAGCGSDVAPDRNVAEPPPVGVEQLAPALEDGRTRDWDAMVRRTHVDVGAVDSTATAEELARAVTPLIEDGMLWMTKSTPRTACLCETTVTDRGRIRDDGTLDLTIDHRPVWLLVYDDVMLPMTDSEQTVLVIIDPETGESSVGDLPYAPAE